MLIPERSLRSELAELYSTFNLNHELILFYLSVTFSVPGHFGTSPSRMIPQTACCRGSGGVGKRGLDPFRETAELPGSSFYCKNRYTVTPTFKTPGKV